MMRTIVCSVVLATGLTGSPALSQELCVGYGPQTPRDISSVAGANERLWTLAPSSDKMNLCNIHTHTNAEHKAPGFSIFAGSEDDGGFQCNETTSLSAAELTDPTNGNGAMKGVKPGDTIEVHWVHSSCDVAPGAGLGACLSDKCANPELRVEAQAFLLVNDPDAADFRDYAYTGAATDGLHQAKSLPAGDPVVFAGSTTGPSYTQQKCSPLQVTWSVRPTCMRLNIATLHQWAEDNPFDEEKSHGVRQLVTAPELLSPIN